MCLTCAFKSHYKAFHLSAFNCLCLQNVRASLLAARKESTCNAGDLDLIPGFRKICWGRDRLPTPVFMPGSSDDKESACNAGDLGWIPELG